MTTEKLAKLFLKTNIFPDHGTLEQIINDKDKLFTSKFNTKLRQVLKMKENVDSFLSTNKRANQRMNQLLEQYFRLFAGNNKHK